MQFKSKMCQSDGRHQSNNVTWKCWNNSIGYWNTHIHGESSNKVFNAVFWILLKTIIKNPVRDINHNQWMWQFYNAQQRWNNNFVSERFNFKRHCKICKQNEILLCSRCFNSSHLCILIQCVILLWDEIITTNEIV